MSPSASTWGSRWTALLRIAGRLLTFSWTRPSAWSLLKRSRSVAASEARRSTRSTVRRYRVVYVEDGPIPFFKRERVRQVMFIMAVAFVAGVGAGMYNTVMMQRHLALDRNLVASETEKFLECKDALGRLAEQHYDGASYDEVVQLMRNLDAARNGHRKVYQ